MTMGVLPARTWRESSCTGNSSNSKIKIEEAKWRQQRVKRVRPRCPSSWKTFGFEVEEELSTMATLTWTDGAWIGKWLIEQKEAWMKQIFEVQTWRQVRGPAGVVMCETLDLGIKWPQWHTFTFEEQGQVDMRQCS